MAQTKNQAIMLCTFIFILLLMNVTSTDIEKQNQMYISSKIELEDGVKLPPLHINQTKNIYRTLNHENDPYRYIPESKRKFTECRDIVFPEGKVGFDKKYEILKSCNYSRWFSQLEYLFLHKFYYCGRAQIIPIINLIISYLFKEQRITVDNTTFDEYVSISELTPAPVHLLSYSPTIRNRRKLSTIFPIFLHNSLSQLMWYFLDLSNIKLYESEHHLFFCGKTINLFCKCYLLFGSKVNYLHFDGIKWNFVEFLRFSTEEIRRLDFKVRELNSTFDLHAERHLLPKFISEFSISKTDIKYIDFREGTIIDSFFIELKQNQKIEWENIFLPQEVKYLQIESSSVFKSDWSNFYLYRGEYIQNPESVQKLKFNRIDIQSLNLLRFTNLEVVKFTNCHVSNFDNIIIPQHVWGIIKINDSRLPNNYVPNLSFLKYKFGAHVDSSFKLGYPMSLKVLELQSWSLKLYKIVNWYENLTVENVPDLHTFTIKLKHELIDTDVNLLHVLKEKLTNEELQLSKFAQLQEITVIDKENARPKEYNFNTFVRDVATKLPNSLQVIRYIHSNNKRQVWCPNEVNTESDGYPKIIQEDLE